MPISRRRFIFGSAAVAVTGSGLGYTRYIEPGSLSLEKVDVVVPSTRLSRSVKILQLTDLHYSSVVSLKFLEKAIELGMSASPDLVCFTGDFFTSNDLFPVNDLMPLLRSVGKAVPALSSLGNHDGGRWSAARGGLATSDAVTHMLEESYIKVLRNSSSRIDIGGQPLAVVGLDDLWSGHPDPASAFSRDKSSDCPVIVLTHNPDSRVLLKDQKWDLALCGHTHGGQVVIPLVGAPLVPIRDREFTAGLNEWQGRMVYTSRGVGSLYGLRFNCPPEVTILELRPDMS